MSSEIAVPLAKQRAEVLKSMTPALREVAAELTEKMSKLATGALMITYDIGSRLTEVLHNEDKYGNGSVEKLAAYYCVSAATVYSWQNFAEKNDKEQVKALSAQPMSNGQFLTFTHWSKLNMLEDKEDRLKLAKQAIKEAWTADELEATIRAMGDDKKKAHSRQGGRKPKAPSSPIIGLNRTYELANKFSRWSDTFDKCVFNAIESVAPDKLDGKLLKSAQRTLEFVAAAKNTAADMEEHLNENIKRIQSVLSKRSEKGEKDEKVADDYREGSGGEATTKKKKKKGKKPVAAE